MAAVVNSSRRDDPHDLVLSMFALAVTAVVLVAGDLAPKFYPVLSSLRLLGLPEWAVVATGAGAEPSA
jgi:hypothetical protein